MLDDERRIVDVNDRACVVLGRERAELLGTDCAGALRPRLLDGTPLLVDAWDRAATFRGVGRLTQQTITVRGRDGDDLRLSVTGRYQRNGGGSPDGIVLILRPLGRAGGPPTGIEVVSTVSHELRSPLTSVKGYTSLLLSRWERLADDQKRMMLEQVHSDADRVTRLVTELLDISRLETGRLVLRRQMVDLATLAATVVEKVGIAYPDLDCAVHFPQGFPRVYADPDKIEQVLTNLVENAAKYGDPKGMHVEAKAGDDLHTVAVTDLGDGIPTADLSRVFRKFYRRDHGKPTGTGLGLWISRGLVEAHGGALTVTSVVGEGTTFSFSVPAGTFDELHDAG